MRWTRSKPLDLSDGWGIKSLQKFMELMGKNLPYSSQESKNNWAEWLGRGGGEGGYGGKGLWSRLVVPTGTKGHPFVPIGVSNRDQLEPPSGTKEWSLVSVGATNRDQTTLYTPRARLAVGPGTKALFGPKSNSSRDKWPKPKACFVVVCAPLHTWSNLAVLPQNMFSQCKSIRYFQSRHNSQPSYMGGTTLTAHIEVDWVVKEVRNTC